MPRGRRRACAAVAVLLLTAASAAAPVTAQPPPRPYPKVAVFEKAWEFELPGWNRSSSPLLADIDSDGRNEVVFGHQDGLLRAYEADGSLKWSARAVPGASTAAECRTQTSPTAIDSSPAAADIDGDGDVEIVVGVGSTWVPYQNGSVIAFDGATGRIEWAFDRSRDTASLWDGSTPILDGWCEGTYSTPAIGDVDGDGSLDVVFGSWDFYIWAVDSDGVPLPGFPINADDTVWSSPALYDVDGDGDSEIFIGADQTPGGYVDHLGGVFWAIDYRDDKPEVMWQRFANEVFHSSPAIGDINGDGRYEAVVGMGHNWRIECKRRDNQSCAGSDGGSDHSTVWAFHLDDGSDVEGWPVNATNTVWASPALGDLDGDAVPEVVVGSYDHYVYSWHGDGTLMWKVKPRYPWQQDTKRASAPPVIADLNGDGIQDVAIGTDFGVAMLDGRDGSDLETDGDGQYVESTHRVSYAHSYEAAPAIGELNGSRHIVVSGFSTPGRFSRVAAHRLPDTETRDAWPMFRGDSRRTGVVSVGTPWTPTAYSDVSPASAHAPSIKALSEAGILARTDCARDSFCPHEPLERWAMAVWLTRAVDDAEPLWQRAVFEDVIPALWWAPHVMRLRDLDVTRGCSTDPLLYCPDQPVTRAQMASFLVRAFGLEAGPPAGFGDTDPTSTHFEAINALARSEITVGCSAEPLRYCPREPVSRAQMATFLARALGLIESTSPSGNRNTGR